MNVPPSEEGCLDATSELYSREQFRQKMSNSGKANEKWNPQVRQKQEAKLSRMVRVKAITILSRQGSHSDGRCHTDIMSSKLKLCAHLFLKAHLENVRLRGKHQKLRTWTMNSESSLLHRPWYRGEQAQGSERGVGRQQFQPQPPHSTVGHLTEHSQPIVISKWSQYYGWDDDMGLERKDKGLTGNVWGCDHCTPSLLQPPIQVASRMKEKPQHSGAKCKVTC